MKQTGLLMMLLMLSICSYGDNTPPQKESK